MQSLPAASDTLSYEYQASRGILLLQATSKVDVTAVNGKDQFSARKFSLPLSIWFSTCLALKRFTDSTIDAGESDDLILNQLVISFHLSHICSGASSPDPNGIVLGGLRPNGTCCN
jgi:hypothetical protein